MSFYGQKNYGQELGNGGFTIATAGCFLTAFSNLLSEYGITMDPPTLNTWFKGHGIYLRDSDGANEDLAWNSITKYAPNIVVTGTGNGAPPSAPAIVKFHYIGVHTGQPIDHFCLVSKIVNGQVYIIDSYDGLEKSPAGYQAVYGPPLQWATYKDTAAAPAPAPTPPPQPSKPPAAPVPIPGNTDNTYSVVAKIKGYTNSSFAANRDQSKWNGAYVDPGTYYVYNRAYSMINVTKKPGSPGSWINPADNVVAAAPLAGPALYDVTRPIPGYMDSNEAANRIDPTVTVAVGTYFVFNEQHGMVNVTHVQGKPGTWINPAEMQDSAPVAPAVPASLPHSEQSTEPAATAAPAASTVPENWQGTYKDASDMYVALKDIQIKDLSQQKAPVSLHQYDLVNIAGTFTGPDGITYGRTATSVKNGWWYAIPMSDLALESELFSVPPKLGTVAKWFAKAMDWIEKHKNKKTPKENVNAS